MTSTSPRPPRPPRPPRDVIPALFGYFDLPNSSGPPFKACLGRDGQDGSLIRIYNGERVVLTPLPAVTHRLAYHDPSGRLREIVYALEWADGATQMVEQSALARRDSWRTHHMWLFDQKGLALVASAIVTGSQEVPLVAGTAGWHDDRYQLPPDGYRPDGMAETGADEEAGRAAWREICQLIADDSPKIALVAGAAFAGPYVSRLQREPFTLHLVGDSSEGKSTALNVAGAVLGDPIRTVWPWNLTAVALGRALGDLATLPAVVDELGSAGMRIEALESLMFRVAGGAARRGANRSGPGTTTSGAWSSVLISSGNRGLSNLSANPGLPVRVVDLPTPITGSAPAADRIAALAHTGAGWPLRWLCDDARLDHFAASLTAAETALHVAAGGQLGRIARHLALCVAGAVQLGWHIAGPTGADKLGAAARGAALEYLADIADTLTETGRMADRLLEAVQQALARRPASFPGPDRYRDRQDPPREADGIYIEHNGTLVIFAAALQRIAADADIDDPQPALRQLADRGAIRREGRHLALKVRLGPGRRPRCYIFTGGPTGPTVAPPENAGVGPPPTPPDNPLTSTFTRENDSAGRGGPTGPTENEVFPYERGVSTYTAAELRGLLEAAEERERRAAEAETARLAEIYERPTVGAVRQTRTPPQPSQRAPAALEERRRRFAHVLAQRGYPDLSAELTADALERFETAARFTYEAPSPARNGMMWLAALEARYWASPHLLAEEVPLPAGRPSAHYSMADPGQAGRPAATVTQLDVNAAFLNAAQSLELGTGPPVHVAKPTVEELRLPGFVVVANPRPDWPHPFARQKPGPVVLPTPLARLLAEWAPDEPAEFVDAHLWPTHRRWLRTFCRAVIDARACLLEQPDEPGRLALVVLKAIYSASLGGMLGSERHNPTAYRRPDWMWQVRAAATAGLWRQLHPTNPGPAAVAATDAIYYLDDPPASLELSARPGKFKIERTVPVTDRIRAALATGRPGALTKAMDHG